VKAAALYDSIIPCFGSRFTVVMMPHAPQVIHRDISLFRLAEDG
jgi:hypothetical protein